VCAAISHQCHYAPVPNQASVILIFYVHLILPCLLSCRDRCTACNDPDESEVNTSKRSHESFHDIPINIIIFFSNAAEEEIASLREAISDGAERVLKFSILYTHPHILPYIKHY
jgi:hypothetical protein